MGFILRPGEYSPALNKPCAKPATVVAPTVTLVKVFTPGGESLEFPGFQRHTQQKRKSAVKNIISQSVIGYLLASTIAGIHLNAEAADSGTLKRGAYLAAVGGCGDCHTPMKLGANGPETDVRRQYSGHPAGLKMPPAPAFTDGRQGPWVWAGAGTNTAFAGPWGMSYAVNLTADKETGLGAWNAADFIRAIKTGKHIGVGRPIMPPIPWQNYVQMTDADLQALLAYLQSVPAISNRAPDYTPPGK